MERRKFLNKSASAIVSYMGTLPLISLDTEAEKQALSLKPNSVILFQGDSITEGWRSPEPPNYNFDNAGRESLEYNDSNALGSGYAFIAGSEILRAHPNKKIKIFNKGISGNKVDDLIKRWDKDCINIKPDVLSILIGVNDFWDIITGNSKDAPEKYYEDYSKLLNITVEALPQTKLIICEPFAITGTKAVNESWFPAFNVYRDAARKLAAEFNAIFIPFQSVFDKAVSKAAGSYWCYDGVHPSIPGSNLMARAWLKAVKL
ncbi:MAG: SGNH/GDSL hydrolase family protein [Chitinophagaceae bacterium]|nr:SGNH/GDSL hydrolase family protein [Chitinophagaceae bacterium]